MKSTIVDTQILSYSYKDTNAHSSVSAIAISSITANEFLLAQPRDADHPDYYVLHPAMYGHLLQTEPGYFAPAHIGNPKWARRGDRRTDQVIIDFGNQFPSYREFGCEAISEIINGRLPDLFKISVAHLPKDQQKYLKKRLRFILDHGYSCYPLSKLTIEVALSLFSIFASQYTCKSNVRNTVNDILILATAIARQSPLLTQDTLLNRFAAEHYDAVIDCNSDGMLIDFSCEEAMVSKRSRESKGFINRGWSYYVRNNRPGKGL